MIKNVIFDIGNVLIDYEPMKYLETFGFDKETNERVAKAVFLSDVWADRDAGLGTEPEFVERFIANDPGVEREIRLFMESPQNTCTEREYARQWLRNVKAQGYHVYILSNYSEQMWEIQEKEYTFFPEAEGAIISYRYKCRKPFPEIYHILFDTYGLVPEECVFLDDSADNIRTAKELGMEGIVVTSHEAAVEGLRKLGIES